MYINSELEILTIYLRTLSLPKNIFQTSKQNHIDSIVKITKLQELAYYFIDKHDINYDNPNKIDCLCIVALKINQNCQELRDSIFNPKQSINADFVIDSSIFDTTNRLYDNLLASIIEFFKTDQSLT